jgi:hypothetical protein
MQDHLRPERSSAATKPSHRKTLLGLAVLALAGAAAFGVHRHAQQATPPAAPHTATLGAAPAAVHLADFHGEAPSPDAKLMANWVTATDDNHEHAFILVDKKDARVYVFNPDGQLKDSAPALLGQARGDQILPGTADKPLAEMKPDEKITPAGRFVAEPGVNADNEDVIWVDYDAAISMHRVRPMVERERRLERLATLTTDDNRISFGCINLPVSFYEDVAKPTVDKYGAVIYVVPEVKTVQQVFGAYDVTDPNQLAAASTKGPAQG